MGSEHGKRSTRAQADERREKILAYIKEYISEHGYAPSYMEIAKNAELSTSQAHSYVNSLASRGVVKVTLGVARSIVPV